MTRKIDEIKEDLIARLQGVAAQVDKMLTELDESSLADYHYNVTDRLAKNLVDLLGDISYNIDADVKYELDEIMETRVTSALKEVGKNRESYIDIDGGV